MSEELQMTVSGIVNKDGRPTIYVSFQDGKSRAEGSVPDCKIISNDGFSPEDVMVLEQYMKYQQDEIRAMAKHISPMDAFFKDLQLK